MCRSTKLALGTECPVTDSTIILELTLSATTPTPKYRDDRRLCKLSSWCTGKRFTDIRTVERWSARESGQIGRRWLFISPGNSGHFDPASDPSSQLVSPVRGLEIYRYVTENTPACIYTSSHLSSHYFQPMCNGTVMISSRLVNGQLDVGVPPRARARAPAVHQHPTFRSVLNIFTGHYAGCEKL